MTSGERGGRRTREWTLGREENRSGKWGGKLLLYCTSSQIIIFGRCARRQNIQWNTHDYSRKLRKWMTRRCHLQATLEQLVLRCNWPPLASRSPRLGGFYRATSTCKEGRGQGLGQQLIRDGSRWPPLSLTWVTLGRVGL